MFYDGLAALESGTKEVMARWNERGLDEEVEDGPVEMWTVEEKGMLRVRVRVRVMRVAEVWIPQEVETEVEAVRYREEEEV